MKSTIAIVLLVGVAVLALVHSGEAAQGLKAYIATRIEKPCRDLKHDYRAPYLCQNCCTNEGFKYGPFLEGRCTCLVRTAERERQEIELERSANENACKHFSGSSHDTTEDGENFQSACDKCCHQNSFRTHTFEVDHSFSNQVGSVKGSEHAGLGHSLCRCVGLQLKFKKTEEPEKTKGSSENK